MTIKTDLKDATLVATVVSVISIAIETPIVIAYVAAKWLACFIGAIIGMVTYRLLAWACKKAWNAYKDRKTNTINGTVNKV